MTGTKMKVNIKPIKTVIHNIQKNHCYIICSDSNEYDYLQNTENKNILLLHVADTEDSYRRDAFNANHANAVRDFLLMHDSDEHGITCACNEGQSRSAAIAAAILASTNEEDIIWKDNKYQPNTLIYRRCLEAFYGDSAKERIDLINEFLSPRGYARFRGINLDNGSAGYDAVYEPRRDDGQTIRYGLLYGSSRSFIIFIKAGRDSALDRKNCKYLKVAADLVSNHHISVICATTPHDRTQQFTSDTEFLNSYFDQEGIPCDKRKVLYFGHSDGASMAVFKNREIRANDMFKAFLFSGLPLYQSTQEFGIVLKKLKEIDDNSFMTLVYGERDKSYERFGSHLSVLAPELDIHVVAGEDHNYSGNKKTIHAIPELFFNDNALENNGIHEL